MINAIPIPSIANASTHQASWGMPKYSSSHTVTSAGKGNETVSNSLMLKRDVSCLRLKKIIHGKKKRNI